MSSNAISFSVYKRKKNPAKKNEKVSPYYYAQFKLSNGSWTYAKSTGKRTKEEAKQWCLDYIRAGQIVIHDNISFLKFADDFFSWEKQWALEKRARGLRISERWARELNRLLNKILIPAIGNYKLTDIDETTIENLLINLYQKGFAGSYVNKAMIALAAILKSAKKQKLIQYIPEIGKVANNPKEKDILSIEEAKLLFSKDWLDFRGYVSNHLAASSGLRLGEIQGITLADVHLDNGYIHIHRSWDSKLLRFNETTKTGRKRNIVIPQQIKNEIQKLIELNPYKICPGDIFLFYGYRQDRPADDKFFSKSLYQALKQIGITEQKRLERNITFHSWRHWYNSLMINNKIPLQKVQSQTGHSTDKMSQHYYHVDDMGDVVQVLQDTLFSDLPGDETVN